MQEIIRRGNSLADSAREALRPVGKLRDEARRLSAAIDIMRGEVIATADLIMEDHPLYPDAWRTHAVKQEGEFFIPQSPAFIAVVGDSGTGKGTIVEALAKKLTIPNTMVGGDMFRRVTDIYHGISAKPSIIDNAVDGLLAAGIRTAVAGRGSIPKLFEGRRLPDIIASLRENEEKRIEEENQQRLRHGLPPHYGPVPFSEGFVVKLTADPRIQAWRYAKRYVTKHGGQITPALIQQEWDKEQGRKGRRIKDTRRFVRLNRDLLKDNLTIRPMITNPEFEGLPFAEQGLLTRIAKPQDGWPYASRIVDARGRKIIHAEVSTTETIEEGVHAGEITNRNIEDILEDVFYEMAKHGFHVPEQKSQKQSLPTKAVVFSGKVID